MRVKVAQDIGFCFGVKRAIRMALDAAKEHGEPVYTIGALIHNPSAIAFLEERGICAAQSVQGIPEGAVAVIRSHGVAPEVYADCRERGLRVVDATCPFVERIHGAVASAYREGRRIVIAGDSLHPECVGINGCCDNTASFINDERDIALLQHMGGNLCIVSQTTASAALFASLEQYARENCPDAVILNTICKTTVARQREAEALAKQCTLMIVVGSPNSSNTRKLEDVCKKYCACVKSVEKPGELSLEKIYSDDIIGIVSGASTPDWIIREVTTRMSELEKTMAESPAENDEVETKASATVEEPIVVEDAAQSAAPAQVAEDTAPEGAATEQPEAAEAAVEEVESTPNTAEAAVEEVESTPNAAEAAVEEVESTPNAAEAGDSDFVEAFEKTMKRIKNGQVLTGSVVQIVDGEVCVNIGYKSDGFISRSEFSSDPDVNPADVVSIGDQIEVEVIKVNDGEGNVVLSRKNIESKKFWDKLIGDEDLESKVFDGVGKEVVKGGLIASIDGVRAFIPASQLSTKYVENIGEYVGQNIKLKIIEVDKSRKRIVASHKTVLLAEAEEAKRQKWARLEVGAKVHGVVRRITDFGAFVDIGGIDGLIHVTDVAWGRVKHPSDVLSIGQEVEVIIRDVDVEKQRVSLGYKQLQPKPWTLADQKYPAGSVVEGKVVRIVPFGAFVALEPTIDGLIHISQVGVKRINKVEDEINVGDIVRCKVLDVNPEARRISLSRREVILDENPEIAEDIAKEKAERERMAAERSEQRAAAAEHTRQVQQQRQQEGRSEPRSFERRERGEHSSHHREDGDYDLPPVQQATTSLADLFAGFNAKPGDDENE